MTAPSSRLGRGLGSLLGEEGMGTGRVREMATLPVNRIVANKDQPRRYFDEEKLMELANSLKEKGMLQPVLVRKLEDGTYQIIAGERRWRAAQIAGMEEIPFIEKDLNDAETLEISLLENIQREDLNPVEQARAFERLVTEYHYSHKQIGDSVGKSRMAVSNSLRLLKLPPAILQRLEQGEISSGHARALLMRSDDDVFLAEIVEKIIKDNLSVREVERMMGQSAHFEPEPVPEQGDTEVSDSIPPVVEALSAPPEEIAAPPEEIAVKVSADPALIVAQHLLTQRFHVPVTIQSQGGKRRVIFECASEEELNRLMDLLQQRPVSG
ncbi:MAG: ParB/RepB/Spo0J family partition protein [Magnetococcales bacterium]|nr:ParB/RepB/Spo0J family partition protein [Magnetococcales bacterium]MBF0419640.1 ParB/RepB/Spo0J family partition protein [Magnetococcales bacterium]